MEEQKGWRSECGDVLRTSIRLGRDVVVVVMVYRVVVDALQSFGGWDVLGATLLDEGCGRNGSNRRKIEVREWGGDVDDCSRCGGSANNGGGKV